jgi:hypothetical protein
VAVAEQVAVVIVDTQVVVVPVDTQVVVDTQVAVAEQAIAVVVDTQVAVAEQAAVVPADTSAVVTQVIVVLPLPPVPAHIASHNIPPADPLLSAAAGVVVVLHFPQYCSMLFVYYFFTLSYLGLTRARRKCQRSLPVKHIIITVFWLVLVCAF